MALVRKFGIGLGKRLILLDTAVNCIPNLSSEPVSGLTESFISSALTFRFAIVSSCPLPWGGSEELWAATALFLAGSGHEVHIFKTNVDRRHPRIARLLAAGCTVTDLLQHPPLRQRLLNRVLPHHRQYTQHQATQRILQQGLLRRRPQLTLVSQGSNFDGTRFAEVCRALELPFVLLSQKAADIFFPPWNERQSAQQAYRAARRCYFVARHNLELTECQLGMALPDAAVVWNPFNVPFESETAAPALGPDGVVRLACVARLEVLDKGLDLLLQVLAQPKWRQRPLHVTFFGSGGDQLALEEMARLLQLEQRVSFAGHVADVPGIWQTHQALVLASRHEGLPLALVEAMLCGRPAIAPDAGGIAEMLVDNETGFLAAAATVGALDAALERAWRARPDWPRLGAQAARHARALVPADAAAQFGSELLRLAVA
jgi:glycosyltransferase involved in cell wall biosynthesis